MYTVKIGFTKQRLAFLEWVSEDGDYSVSEDGKIITMYFISLKDIQEAGRDFETYLQRNRP